MNTDEVINVMREQMAGAPVTLPPESFIEMGAEILNYEEGLSIEISAPLYKKYNNPAGMILGGFIPTFFDLAYGPLSFLVAQKPTTSLDLNTTFIKPVWAKDEKIHVKASVVSRSKSYLILEARAFNPKGDLVATSTSRMRILG